MSRSLQRLGFSEQGRIGQVHGNLPFDVREGGTFAFSGELAEKRRQLAEIEKSLAADVDDARPDEIRAAAA